MWSYGEDDMLRYAWQLVLPVVRTMPTSRWWLTRLCFAYIFSCCLHDSGRWMYLEHLIIERCLCLAASWQGSKSAWHAGGKFYDNVMSASIMMAACMTWVPSQGFFLNIVDYSLPYMEMTQRFASNPVSKRIHEWQVLPARCGGRDVSQHKVREFAPPWTGLLVVHDIVLLLYCAWKNQQQDDLYPTKLQPLLRLNVLKDIFETVVDDTKNIEGNSQSYPLMRAG